VPGDRAEHLQAAWNFQARLNKFLRRRWVGVKHGVIAPAPLPDEAVEILEALKATMPPSRIFEGEAEYRANLQTKGSVEIDDNDYVSQTTPRPTQSWD